jgi:hypothetical protein
MTMHRLTLPFSPGNFFTKNNISLFPRLKIQLNSCHFDRIEVIEAESQAVLNFLTECNIQDVFKKSRSSVNSAYMLKGITSRVMVASRLKVSF